jgi:hypothetical protein
MRWTEAARVTNAPFADGKGAWSWHPDAGVKFANSFLASDGGQKARRTGEIALYAVAPSRRECRFAASPVVTELACSFYFARKAMGAGNAPGIPCALYFRRGSRSSLGIAMRRPGNALSRPQGPSFRGLVQIYLGLSHEMIYSADIIYLTDTQKCGLWSISATRRSKRSTN